MKRMSRFSLLAASAIVALAASGIGGASAQTLSVVMESRLSVLDPVISTSHQSRNHGYMIYDTLLALDAEGNIQPQMVDGWTVSDDGKVYTFTLREGLTWHDGAPVTAADCVASIERWAKIDRMGIALTPFITSIEAVDERTFTVSQSIASDLILTAFSKPAGVPLFIMPERIAQTPTNEPVSEYIGSGPFRFIAEAFEPGAKVVYEKFENYVPRSEPASGLAGGKVVHVDRVERIEMNDPLTSVNALINGEIDYLETVPFDLLPMVQSAEDVKVETVDPIGYQTSFRFNHLHPPFNNRLVRQAAVYAIGQEAPLQTQIGNPDYYSTCAAVFGCGLPLESDELSDMVIPSNIERAKELLAEAGYSGEKVVILQATDIPMIASMPLVMAQQLREAGFNVDVQAMDFMTLLSRRSNRGSVEEGGWSIFVTTWHNTEIADPIRSFTTTANGADAWAGWPDVPAVTEASKEYVAATDDATRKEIAAKIHRLALEEGVITPIGKITKPTGYRANVSGILQSPAPVFWNIAKGE